MPRKKQLPAIPPAQAHSKLGPSKAHRWLYCHASVFEEQKYPSTSSKYAVEGQCAHRLAELCLLDAVNRRRKKPESYIGDICDETGLAYNAEMVEAVRVYLDTILDIYDPGKDEIYVEEKMHAPDIHEQLFGTVDCLIVKPRKIVTIDFKYGRGITVGAEGNEQMLTYSLMAVVTKAKRSKLEQIIVQPRLDDPASRVSRWSYGKETLEQFRNLVDTATRAIEGKNPQFAPDEKRCHFCRASGNCQAQESYTLEVMGQDFEVIADDSEFDPPEPSGLSPERIAFVLDHRKAIIEWLNAVEAHAITELTHHGDSVPGYKVVHGRANRKWKSSEASSNPKKFAKKLVKALPSVDKDDLLVAQLKTIRQVESLVKSDKKQVKALEKFWEKPPGKLTLVPASDGRKGISSLDDYE